MNTTSKAVTSSHKSGSAATKKRRGFLGFFFRVAPKKVEEQLFDGADIGKFNLSTTQGRAFVEQVSENYVRFLVSGEELTPEAFMKLGHVRRTLSDVIMQSIGLKSEIIALPLSNSPKNPFNLLCERLINEFGREVIPDGVKFRKFTIKFVGGAKSNPDSQLPKGAAAPTPAISPATKAK